VTKLKDGMGTGSSGADVVVQKQQLRVQEDIRDAALELVEKLTEVARGLVLR
jgi:hypothetical protein